MILPFLPFIMVYRVFENAVEIVDVIHGAALAGRTLNLAELGKSSREAHNSILELQQDKLGLNGLTNRKLWWLASSGSRQSETKL